MPLVGLQFVESSGGRDYPASDTQTDTLRAEWTPDPSRADRAATAFDILNDPLCPRRGDHPIDWRNDLITDTWWNGGYVTGVLGSPDPTPPDRPGATADETYLGTVQRAPRHATMVVESVQARMEFPPEAQFWLLEVRYAGEGDPLAEIPEVTYDPVPYQTQEVVDRHGMLKCNSALDPYPEGTPKDRTRRRLTITRTVAYDQWSPLLADAYENTLNRLAYRHGSLTTPATPPADPVPVESPPLTAKLLSLSAVRVPAKKAATPGRRAYHWRVTAVIEFDTGTFTDNNGRKQLKRWRTVLADAGLNQLTPTGFTGPAPGLFGPTSPVPLDGAGRFNQWQFSATSTTPQLREVPVECAKLVAPVADAPTPTHLFFATRPNQQLAVGPPGLLAGADVLLGTETAALSGTGTHGTPSVNSNGSFTFSPATDYRGFAWFEFTLTRGAATSNKAVCLIFVAEQLKVRVFEEYEPADWTPIAHLIGGW